MSNATQSALRGRRRGEVSKTAFGGIDKSALRPTEAGPDYPRIQRSTEFRALSRKLKWFAFPMTALFLAWYLGYVLIAAYASEFMARPVFGEVNIGLLMGVGQFVSTVGITALYVRFTRKHVDPRVDEIRRDADGEPR